MKLIKALAFLPQLPRIIMTLGDIFPGTKTHTAMAGVVATALAPLVVTVINPYMAGTVTVVEAATLGWPFVATILGAFGFSAKKASDDRAKSNESDYPELDG